MDQNCLSKMDISNHRLLFNRMQHIFQKFKMYFVQILFGEEFPNSVNYVDVIYHQFGKKYFQLNHFNLTSAVSGVISPSYACSQISNNNL